MRSRKGLAAALLAFAAVLQAGCTSSPNAVGTGQAISALPGVSGSTTTTTTTNGPVSATAIAGSSSPVATYQAAAMVKVVFNKANFYTNNNPNGSGCAGDARYYFDPNTDRVVPVAPSWLRNIAVDITNSNAPDATRSYGCSLTGQGTAPAANCAAFDDLQPLNGTATQSVIIGGYGCTIGVTDCTPNALLSDVWTMNTSDVTTATGWSQQNASLPSIPPLTNTNPPSPGVAWHGGDFDALHNQYFLFGGVTPPGGDPTQPGLFSNSVMEINFEASGAVSTVYQPTAIIAPQSTTSLSYSSAKNNSGVFSEDRHFYAGWAKAGGFDTALNAFFPPPAMAGPTFTWGLRRNPTLNSECVQGTAPASFGGEVCNAGFSYQSFNSSTAKGSPVTLVPAISTNDNNDYYLLVGGMRTNGLFSKSIYIYKPHPFSNDVGGGGIGITKLPVGGDWNLVSNVPAISGIISGSVMSVVDVGVGPSGPSGATGIVSGASGSSTLIDIPFITTEPGQPRQAGDIFSGWLGRAYHGSVYDPAMNRFYIFGGLVNQNANIGAPLPATSVVPDVATSDIWIYDPPAIGRRPTAACFTNQMPDGTPLISPLNPLPVGEGLQPFAGGPTPAASPGNGANYHFEGNTSYDKAPYVFPPGGCLQRYQLDFLNPGQLPPGRFAHGQAFDPDNKLVYIFGGCDSPTIIHGSGATNAGDPVYQCPGTGLLNDLWVYVPPIVRDLVPQAFSTTSFATSILGPYNPLTLLTNPSGTDLWLDHLPFFVDNQPTNPGISAPEPFQALGNWIHMLPSTLPYPRAGAMMSFDRAHGLLYVQGGFGCIDANCVAAPRALNDLWVYTPPVWDNVCSTFRELGYCSAQAGLNQGSWTQLIPTLDASALSQPTERYGGTMALANTQFTYGDDYYTVWNSSCNGQGPVNTGDTTESSEYVGAIYVDIDRSQMPTNSNLLINVRMLPFNANVKLPAYNNGGVPNGTVNVLDNASSTDQATIRVQFMNDPLSSPTAIQSSLQPRFHEFLTGAQTFGDTVVYAAGPNGQVTEKQIFVPLELNPSINMIKIERVTGSIKFFELTVSQF